MGSRVRGVAISKFDRYYFWTVRMPITPVEFIFASGFSNSVKEKQKCVAKTFREDFLCCRNLNIQANKNSFHIRTFPE